MMLFSLACLNPHLSLSAFTFSTTYLKLRSVWNWISLVYQSYYMPNQNSGKTKETNLTAKSMNKVTIDVVIDIKIPSWMVTTFSFRIETEPSFWWNRMPLMLQNPIIVGSIDILISVLSAIVENCDAVKFPRATRLVLTN